MIAKLSGAWKMLLRRGPGAVVGRLYWYAERWWYGDNWLLGKLVELRGNQVTLDGCHFDLSSPVIMTPQKAGFWLGNYEMQERIAVQQIPDLGLPVVELGGGIGVVSCVTSKHFGNPTAHVVVEANPNMIAVLERQRALNGSNFSVLSAHLAYQAAEVPFHVNAKFLASSAFDQSDQHGHIINVPAISLRAILDQHGFDKIVLICDIEGAEASLFDEESDLIASRVKYLVLEFHPKLTGREVVETIRDKLKQIGFTHLYQGKDNNLFLNESI
jgi:FkbM family methyltransferase